MPDARRSLEAFPAVTRFLPRLCPLLSAASAGALVLAVTAAPARAMAVQCGAEGGDAFGWAVAAGGDWDGDGVKDFAVGAPCASSGDSLRVGRVKIFAGHSGALLQSFKGSDAEQEFGASLAWLPDVDGDGRAELAVGSATADAPKPGGGFLITAGKVELFSSGGGVLWTVYGPNAAAALGESLGALSDLNFDGKVDLVAGASGAQVLNKVRGRGYLLSGASGAKIAQSDGSDIDQQWASVVGSAGDLDLDGTEDWVVATKVGTGPIEPPPSTTTTSSTSTTTTTLPPRAGQLSVISGKAPFPVLRTYVGDTWVQRLGRAAQGAGNVDGDDTGDLWIGSPGAEPGDLEDAGAVELYSGRGPLISEVTEPTPQRFAGFGTALVVPGSLDGGSVDDLVASAPLGKVLGRSETGRVHAFRGENGNWLWSRSGTSLLERFGHALASGLDYDDDGTPDVVVGAPGATPHGRRGAGAASVLSGLDGATLATFGGRRGRETRIFVSGPGLDRRAVVRSFDAFGHRAQAELHPFPTQRASSLSMAVLDEGRRGETFNGSTTLLAVATGAGGASPRVAVYRVARRRLRVSLFTAGPEGYTGGLNVTGGDFGDLYGDEIAVAPADPVEGATTVVIWRKPPSGIDPFGGIPWTKVREFPVFSPQDEMEGVLIGAKGAWLASADLTSNTQDEIVATPMAGLPVVRIYSRIGVMLSQWQAFLVSGDAVEDNSGLRAAIGNLDGEGPLEIVTSPARGQPWVRAWNIDGTPWEYAPGKAVNFAVTQYGGAYSGGLQLALADVDFDGSAEIVVTPASGLPARVLAFEPNGTLVVGWEAFEPFGPTAGSGVGLFAFDQFWKR